jgi:hypothetical protein
LREKLMRLRNLTAIAAISTILDLPANSLPDAIAFGTTDVSLYSKI